MSVRSTTPTRVKRKGRKVVARYGGYGTATYMASSTRSARRLAARLERGECEKVDFKARLYIRDREEE